MLRFEDVEQVASSMRLVLQRNVTKQDGITYRYSLYDNNQFVEDFFEPLAQAWRYIYYYEDEEREHENYRANIEPVEATID